ncbi:MAG: ATP-binding cassette domain-containing protein [Oscillospiraceae bacterium]|nr:ATP-binding cassette domain-containing protein [Oscillospiraceae bacterium]
MSFFELPATVRKKHDERVYEDAFGDLLSVLGSKSPYVVREAKGAIATILNFFGKECPEIPENITDISAQLEYMLRPSGTMKRRVELIGDWWKDGTGILLASTKKGEVIVLFPRGFKGYEYKSKKGETIKITKENASEISNDAFCFYRSFPLGSLKIKDLIIFMAECISFGDILFIIGILILMQFLGMLNPYITNIVYDILIPSNSYNLMLPIASMTIGLTIGASLINITQGIIRTRIQGKLNLSVNSAIMMRLFSLPPSFFRDYSSGELASRVGYVASLCQIISDTVLSTILSALFSLTYIFQMGQQAPGMVVPGMLAIFASILFSILITFLRQGINKKKTDLSPKLQSLVFSIFGGIQKIKISGAEKRAFAKWAKSYSKVEQLDYSPPWIIRLSGVISTIISSLGTIALYWAAAKNNVPVANYMAFNMAYGAVSGAIMSLGGVVLQIANLKPILDLVKPFIQAKPENSSGGSIVTVLAGDIEINNVAFRYSQDTEPVLKNLSLKLRRGEYVAIVGKTGCGKSTILRLLLGFETPEKGGVYYSGRDIRSLDLGSLRQKIGVVMQNGSIFPGDVFSNVVVTSPWKTMDDAWEAVRMAGLEKDIQNMPMGMHTLIAEGGGGLSGGQKQRLMIARAIIAKPSILYLDEATSALDNITQSHVVSSLSELNCTRIVIAHRLSTVKNCDRILVLDEGEIAEEGNFEKLMGKKGKFYNLAKRQVAE